MSRSPATTHELSFTNIRSWVEKRPEASSIAKICSRTAHKHGSHSSKHCLHPVHTVRIHTMKNPRSRTSGPLTLSRGIPTLKDKGRLGSDPTISRFLLRALGVGHPTVVEDYIESIWTCCYSFQ